MDCGGMTCLPDRQAPLSLHAPLAVCALELSNALQPFHRAAKAPACRHVGALQKLRQFQAQRFGAALAASSLARTLALSLAWARAISRATGRAHAPNLPGGCDRRILRTALETNRTVGV